MNWPETVVAIVAVLTMTGGGSAYIMRSLDRRFDQVGRRFDVLERAVGDVRERVARIEGRLTRR